MMEMTKFFTSHTLSKVLLVQIEMFFPNVGLNQEDRRK